MIATIVTQGRRAGVTLARLAVAAIASHFLLLALYLPEGDRAGFGVELLDVRGPLVLAAAVGALFAFLHRSEGLKWAWVVLSTFATVGRGLALIFVGSPELTRGRELLGVLSWTIVFLAAQMAAVILTAERILLEDEG